MISLNKKIKPNSNTSFTMNELKYESNDKPKDKIFVLDYMQMMKFDLKGG